MKICLASSDKNKNKNKIKIRKDPSAIFQFYI